MTGIYTNNFNNLNLYADQALKSLKGKKIIFLVWSLDVSGGTNIILNHALFLHKTGADVYIKTQPNQNYSSWHPALSVLKIFHDAPDQQFDICVVTWWRTIFELLSIRSQVYINFIQSIESRFYYGDQYKPELSRAIESIYSYGLPVITVANWLQMYLAKHHHSSSLLVRNGINKKTFNLMIRPKITFENNKKTVVVEGPIGVDFKRTELLLQSLQKIRKDINIIFVTGSDLRLNKGLKLLADAIISKVPIVEMGAVYASGDILLKASLIEGMFGPPLEMFHCGGTAICTDVTGADEYMIDGYNSVILSPDNLDVIPTSIIELFDNGFEKLRSLKKGAVETAKYWPSLEYSSMEYATAMMAIYRVHADAIGGRIQALKDQIQEIGY